MKLSSKHSNEQNFLFNDFSGGLNSTVAQEMIADNELSFCENMEIDQSTRLLKVVDGNKNIFTPAGNITLKSVMYDVINHISLVVDGNNAVYKIDLTADKPVLSEPLGALTGNLFPCYASWESGVLIASGGKLQYYNGTSLVTLANSKDKCSAVYVKSGRVLVNDLTAGNESNIYLSATGDEETWLDTSSDDSSSKWLEVGYKDGGKIIAFVPMSSDVLVIKDNKCIYRIVGDYPNWSVPEVSRNTECISPGGFYAAGSSAYILGTNKIQYLDTAQFYGDIKPKDIGTKVADKLQTVQPNSRMIHVPPLRQVWIPLQQRYVLIFDYTVNAFYMRRFVKEDITDVLSIGSDVYVVRPTSICKIAKNVGYDNGEKMMWRFIGKRNVSSDDFLLKRAKVSITPYFNTLIEGNIHIGAAVLPLPTPQISYKLWHNYSRLYHNRRKICTADERSYDLYATGELLYENFEPLWHNYKPLYNPAVSSMSTRANNRMRTIGISGTGSGCCFTINSIEYRIAEV